MAGVSRPRTRSHLVTHAMGTMTDVQARRGVTQMGAERLSQRRWFGQLASLKGEANAWLQDHNYDTLKLRLEGVHAVESRLPLWRLEKGGEAERVLQPFARCVWLLQVASCL
jgi:hypothetical protein